MANKTVTLNQPALGIPDTLQSVTVVDTYADWLVANGYATAEGGNASSYDGTTNTSVAAAGDPTLAANREAAGAAQALMAPGTQARIEKSGSRDTVAKTRGNVATPDSAGVTDTSTVVKTP
jgi:hypothetical protein